MADTELDVVDVLRDDRWSQVLLMAASSTSEARTGAAAVQARDPTGYVGIISADLGPELPEILAALRPGLHEIVCFDSLARPSVTGQDLAYTVASLEDAIDDTIDVLLEPDRHGWEGRFLVVVGPAPVLARARRHLGEPGPGADLRG